GTASPGAAAIVTGSGTTYNVAVSGMTGNGPLTATIATDKAHDLAGNGNAASSSSDNTVLYFGALTGSYQVNSTSDDNTDDGVCAPPGVGNGCTLREAITSANSDGVNSTITFDPAVFATAQTITLSRGELVLGN